MAVDIGKEAIERDSDLGTGDTYINKGATASVAGLVTSVDIWAYSNITGLKVGIFYTTNGDTLKCRSAESIAGTITAGSKVNEAVSLAVEIGDYIGCYYTGGGIQESYSGGAGIWQYNGDLVSVDAENEYDVIAGEAFSLGGYIEEVPQTYERSATTDTGIAPSASRSLKLARESSVEVGIEATADRRCVYHRYGWR